MPQQTRRPRSMYFKKFYKVLLHQRVYIWGEGIWQLALLALVSDSMPIKSKAKFDIAWYSTKFSELLTTIDWKRRHFTAAEYCEKTNTYMFCLQKLGQIYKRCKNEKVWMLVTKAAEKRISKSLSQTRWQKLCGGTGGPHRKKFGLGRKF